MTGQTFHVAPARVREESGDENTVSPGASMDSDSDLEREIVETECPRTSGKPTTSVSRTDEDNDGPSPGLKVALPQSCISAGAQCTDVEEDKGQKHFGQRRLTVVEHVYSSGMRSVGKSLRRVSPHHRERTTKPQGLQEGNTLDSLQLGRSITEGAFVDGPKKLLCITFECDKAYTLVQRLIAPCLAGLSALGLMAIKRKIIVWAWEGNPSESLLNLRNDTFGSYLCATSLIYAIVFGVLLEDSTSRHSRLQKALEKEIASVRAILLNLFSLSGASLPQNREHKVTVLRSLLIYMVGVEKEVSNPHGALYSNSFGLARALYPSMFGMVTDDVADPLIVKGILRELRTLASAPDTRRAEANYFMPLIMWALILVISVSMFFSVLFLETQSMKMDLTLCGIAVIGMCLLNYIISDLSQPFYGLFHVDISSVCKLKRQLEELCASENVQLD